MKERKHPKGDKTFKHKNKDDDEEEEPVDLVFCFQASTILKDVLKKIEYIGTYTVSNSKSAMSKMIGIQIDNKLKKQQELELKFEDLIIEKTNKINLVEEDDIIDLNKKIKVCAEELKSSTNNICKTLQENPDIPKNLHKAKEDQKLLISDLNKFFPDFTQGKLDEYRKVIDVYEKRKINIDQLRKEEMLYFTKLKELNANLSEEEANYNKDKMEKTQALLRMKKLLAKTKLEEDIFIKYETNQIHALSALHLSNFADEETKMRREIKEKEAEKEKISKLNEFVYEYLRLQRIRYEDEKKQWDQKLSSKAALNENISKGLMNRNRNKRLNIEHLEKQIKNYNIANDHLMKVAGELNYTNYAIIHGPDAKLPVIDNVPEQLDPETKKPMENIEESKKENK